LWRGGRDGQGGDAEQIAEEGVREGKGRKRESAFDKELQATVCPEHPKRAAVFYKFESELQRETFKILPMGY